MSARRVQQALIIVLIGAGIILLLADRVGLYGAKAKTSADVPATNAFMIVQTTKSVKRGAVIHEEDVEARPSSTLPQSGSISYVTEATGRVATRDIAMAERLSTANTMAALNMGTLAKLIPAGLRAVALRVTDDSAVANLIQPGDHVDVLVISNPTRVPQEGTQTFPDAEARTILQNIEVLAVGDLIVGGAKSGPTYRNVTLAVTPKQAAMVALTRSVGTQYLSLRATDDLTDSNAGASLTTDDLHLSGNNLLPKSTISPAPSDNVVTVYRGAKKTSYACADSCQHTLAPLGGGP